MKKDEDMPEGSGEGVSETERREGSAREGDVDLQQVSEKKSDALTSDELMDEGPQ